MTAPDSRVSSLVAEGRITPEEGARLQRAMRSRADRRWTLAANPAEIVRPPVALLLASCVVLASLAISQLGIRFDGAIDVHRVAGTPPWRTALIDQLVGVLMTASVFWLVSLATWRRGRWRDFVLSTAIARAPALFLCAWSLLMVPQVPPPEELLRLAQSNQVPVRLIVSSIGSLPLFAWLIFWLYRGFAFASGARGARAVVVFTLALVMAVVLGELAVSALVRL